MQLKLTDVTRTITACAVLHNIGIDVNDPWDENDNEEELGIIKVPSIPIAANNRGSVIRAIFIERHFS